MSPASSTDKNRGVYVQKPKSDGYTVLLLLSAVAVLVGILFLYLEINSYSSMSPGPMGMVGPPAGSATSFAWSNVLTPSGGQIVSATTAALLQGPFAA